MNSGLVEGELVTSPSLPVTVQTLGRGNGETPIDVAVFSVF